MRHLLVFLVAICFGAAYGQSFVYPSIKLAGRRVADFVPPGWMVLDSAYGDLNKDGIKDAAIVIQHKDSVLLVDSLEDTVLTQPRILLLFFKKAADNSYELVEQSNSFILKHESVMPDDDLRQWRPIMDDPYQDIAIANSVLKVSFRIFYSMGSWNVTGVEYKFRYQQGGFALIGADYSSYHRGTMDSEDYTFNFLTKKKTVAKGNLGKSGTRQSWKPLAIPALKTLKTFSEPFSWEVEPDFYL